VWLGNRQKALRLIRMHQRLPRPERDRLGVAGATAPDDIQSNTGLEFALVLRPDLDASAFGSSFRRKPESSFTDTSKSWIPAFAGMTNIFFSCGPFGAQRGQYFGDFSLS